MTTKITPKTIDIQANDEVVTPRVVKRQGKPDIITANFKRRSTFRWIPFNSLHIDPIYQRRLRKQRAITMAHNWNPDKMGTLVVNQRSDGRYYIVDGQHRYYALKLIENHPPRLYCEVFVGLTRQEEAQLFHDLDNERANLTAGASFKALVAANNPAALGVNRAANRAGLTVDYEKGAVEGNVRAFKTLQEIYNRQGEDGLSRILSICANAWPNSNHAGNASMLLGLEIFLNKYGDMINDKRLSSVLSVHDPKAVVNTGRVLNGTLSSQIYNSVAMAIKIIYNKGMRVKRLPDLS